MVDKIYIGFNDERVEATGDLLAEVLASQAAAKDLVKKRELEAQTKAAAKAAAQAKLTALGLTVEDLQALGL